MIGPVETSRGERVTVVLEPALRDALAHEARRERRSVSSFIRNLIADAVERGGAGDPGRSVPA